MGEILSRAIISKFRRSLQNFFSLNSTSVLIIKSYTLDIREDFFEMRVGIIGYGFVGKALANGIKNKVDIFKVDPKLGTSISDLINFNPEIIFICVPTPMNDDGSQDIKILKR